MATITITAFRRAGGRVIARLADGSVCEWPSLDVLRDKARRAKAGDRLLYFALLDALRDDPALTQVHSNIRCEQLDPVRTT